MGDAEVNDILSLPVLEARLLWTMRAWVIGHCHGENVAGRIEKVFAYLGTPQAAEHLQGFMAVLGRGARRPLEVNCVCNPAVSGDELALLRVIALQQGGAGEGAYGILAGMLDAGAIPAACRAACRLATALRAAGHGLRRSSPGGGPMEPAAAWEAGPAPRYLH